MRPSIYIPIWFLKSLDPKAQEEVLKTKFLSTIYGYTGNEFEIKLLEDEHYYKCSEQFKRIYETEDKLLDQERELKHLRQIKQSVDQIKNLFK
jgi:hypothetical protein